MNPIDNLRMSELLLKQETSQPNTPAVRNGEEVQMTDRDSCEDTVYSYFQISQPRKKNESYQVRNPYTKLQKDFELRLSKQKSIVS